MAQAARLNLRMQKEVKLLLTDPPPGASFPSLFEHPSLTSIDAHFQGPEGTVYSNGVFKIKIQIPERYPFQPPIVTFATPIYHPNIDNGGRICLDILNLPPKGTWQPSLNISTVLTSIGLLLSEPNPDDGLMHEASREYKYNRQAFDQNARSVTEKYARAGESESCSRDYHASQMHADPSAAQTEIKGPDGYSTNSNSGKEIYKVPSHDYSKSHIKIGRVEEPKKVATEYNMNPGILQEARSKLSLRVSVVSHIRNGESANINPPNLCLSPLRTQTVDSPETSPLVQVGNNHELASSKDENYKKTSQGRDSSEKLHPLPKHDVSELDSNRSQTSHNQFFFHNIAIAGDSSGSTSLRLKKVALVGPPPSSRPRYPEHYLEDEKENLGSITHVLPQLTDKSAVPENVAEAVIVLDSEDSEEENIPVRSKLSLTRRCLSRKRKSAM